MAPRSRAGEAGRGYRSVMMGAAEGTEKFTEGRAEFHGHPGKGVPIMAPPLDPTTATASR